MAKRWVNLAAKCQTRQTCLRRTLNSEVPPAGALTPHWAEGPKLREFVALNNAAVLSLISTQYPLSKALI